MTTPAPATPAAPRPLLRPDAVFYICLALLGATYIVLIVAINLVGDQVRDQLNPRLKR